MQILTDWSDNTQKRLDAVLAGGAGLAAFDFDHTLIHGDQGEAVMAEMVLGGHVCAGESWFWDRWPESTYQRREKLKNDFERYKHFNEPDLLADWLDGIVDVYEQIHAEHGTEAAYRWSSIFFAGLLPDQMQALSKTVFDEQLRRNESVALPSGRELPPGIRIKPQVQSLIETMHKEGWQVYIVTASPKIAIAAIAERWGIDQDHVVGMELEPLADGRLGPHIIEPYSCGDGKVSALREKTQNPLRFAAGDSMMDLPLLEAAENSLVLDRGSVRLRQRAEEKGWIFESISP